MTERSGEELLNNAVSVFRRFTIQQSTEAYDALALYSAYTHASHCFQFAPRLLCTSAEKRSGKTRTIEIATALCRDPLVAANATVPAIFRSLGQGERPRTLVFDEADTIFGTKMKAEQNEDLRGLINAGFQQGTPVLRTVGPNHEPTEFKTFAPVIMAGIGNMPDTITDRAVNIRLRRRKSTESVDSYRIRKHEPGLHDLRESLTGWLTEHADYMLDAEPENPLEDRAADLWEPLLVIADLAGGTWPHRARIAARKIAGQAEDEDHERSDGLELLHDTRNVLESYQGDWIQSTVLLNQLRGIEDSRWQEIQLTGRKLSDLLKPYQVHTGRMPSGNARGYRISSLRDVFERYLSTPRPELTEVTGSPETQRIRTVAS